MSDPRVYFAAERTLLAWIRTGITIIALGFVVSRFALFLRLVVPPDAAVAGDAHGRWISDLLGVSLVLIGSGVIALA
ncbi:MAG: YidH family protein, partial [Candidatus Binatia bacterium]